MLSNGEIGYYTAVATAIPVLLVAYVVGVQSFARDTVFPRAEKIQRGMYRRLFDALRDVENRGRGVWTLSHTVLLPLYQLTGIVLLVAAVLLPAIGEIASLRALFDGRPNADLRSLSEVGIFAAGVVVLFPLTLRVLRVAFFSSPIMFIGGELTLTLLFAGLLLTGWRRSWLSLIDPEVRLIYVGHDGITALRGSDRFDEFASLAWGTRRQRAGKVLPINERELLVLDSQTDPSDRVGATRYTRRKLRLVRAVAYASVADALTQFERGADTPEMAG